MRPSTSRHLEWIQQLSFSLLTSSDRRWYSGCLAYDLSNHFKFSYLEAYVIACYTRVLLNFLWISTVVLSLVMIHYKINCTTCWFHSHYTWMITSLPMNQKIYMKRITNKQAKWKMSANKMEIIWFHCNDRPLRIEGANKLWWSLNWMDLKA